MIDCMMFKTVLATYKTLNSGNYAGDNGIDLHVLKLEEWIEQHVINQSGQLVVNEYAF